MDEFLKGLEHIHTIYTLWWLSRPLPWFFLNLNGIKNKQKRHVFNFLKSSKHDIIYLQETHQQSDEKRKWAHEWSAKSERGTINGLYCNILVCVMMMIMILN